MSDDEDQAEVDLSVIQKSIEISGNMIEQVLKGIHYGSPEVRCLLYSECDYILECKICRNLFRSLPNFVAHKRAYCTVAFQQSDTFLNLVRPDEDTVIIQPEAPEDTKHKKQELPRTLETTVQQLKDGTLGHSSAYKLYSQAADKMEQQREARKTKTLTLEPIPNTTKAMKVTVVEGLPEVKTDPSASTITDMEDDSSSVSTTTPLQSSPTATLKSMLLKSALEGDSPITTSVTAPAYKSLQSKTAAKSVLSPPKKMTLRCKEGLNSMPWKKARKDDQETKSPENGMDFNSLECLECNTAFRSKKTLIFHYQNAHCGKRTFFPCPYCNSVFFYIFGLTRHLMRGHNKSKAQVDKMRDKLKKSSFVKEVTSQCQSARQQIKHVKDSQGDNSSTTKTSNRGKTKSFKLEVNDIIETMSYHSPTKESDHICSKCGRTFGKKLNLLNHRKICLTQGCSPISTFHNSKQNVSSTENTESTVSQISKDRVESTLPNNSKSKAESTKRLKEQESPPEIKRPLTKTTALSTNRRFSSRAGNPRHNINELIHSGFSSSMEDDMEDSDDAKENSSITYKKGGNLNRPCGDNCSAAEKAGEQTEGRDFKHQKVQVEAMEVKREIGTDTYEDSQNIRSGVIEEIWVDKQPGRPAEKIKSNRTYVMTSSAYQRLECQDTKKVSEIVNENDLHCIHCEQEFSNVSNLRRHAIRHLGWKRYKCKMCKFSSYNKSECNTHLYRTHSDRFRNVSSINSLIVDLGKEGSRCRLKKKQQTQIDNQAVEEAIGSDCYIQEKSIKRSRKKPYPNPEEVKISPTTSTSPKKKEEKGEVIPFNISTRNSPREFDISPYRKVDRMSTLCTRKSSYPKKITVNSFCHKESDDEDDARSTLSHTSLNSKSSRSDVISVSSENSFVSAKSKIDENKMDVSDTDSEILTTSKNKSGDYLQTRRRARTVVEMGKNVSSSSLTKVNDCVESKASRNITPDLMTDKH